MDTHEKILILSKDRDFAREISELLKRAGVEIVDVVPDPSGMRGDELRFRYKIILIDKHFAGDAAATAMFVRQIRKEFSDPIIGVELVNGNGGLFPLQVAGCNFIAKFTGLSEVDAKHNLLQLIDRISSELELPHQQI